MGPKTEFNPQAFIIARESRGITQSKLADRIGMSQGAISKIQDGLREFPEDKYETLEKALGYPISFFFIEWGKETVPSFFYRRYLSITKSALMKIEARMSIKKRQLSALLKSVDRKPPRLPQISPDDIEGGPLEIARQARLQLRVPIGPIPDLMRVIERAGVIIAPFDFDTAKVAACL